MSKRPTAKESASRLRGPGTGGRNRSEASERRLRGSSDLAVDHAIRTCAWCGNGIPESKRLDAIYCSSRCKAAANRALPCEYCGLPSDGSDVIEPATLLAGREVEPVTVACCRECRELGAGVRANSSVEKRAFVRARLEERYAKVLELPAFSREEVEDLGVGLRALAHGTQRLGEIAAARVSWEGAEAERLCACGCGEALPAGAASTVTTIRGHEAEGARRRDAAERSGRATRARKPKSATQYAIYELVDGHPGAFVGFSWARGWRQAIVALVGEEEAGRRPYAAIAASSLHKAA